MFIVTQNHAIRFGPATRAECDLFVDTNSDKNYEVEEVAGNYEWAGKAPRKDWLNSKVKSWRYPKR